MLQKYYRPVVSTLSAEIVLSRLDAEDRAFVERFVELVREHFGSRLKDLRLFGSKVRGDDHSESDIDVLILVDGGAWADVEAALDLAGSVSGKIQPEVFDFDQYHSPKSRATGFYKEMRKESVRL